MTEQHTPLPSRLEDLSACTQESIQELLRFPVRYLADLPLKTTLWCMFARGETYARCVMLGSDISALDVVFTNDPKAYALFIARGAAAFSPIEYESLVIDAERGMVTAEDFERVCGLKRQMPRGHKYKWRSKGMGVDGAGPKGRMWWGGDERCPGHWMDHGWTWGRLLHEMGLRLGLWESQGASKAHSPAPIISAPMCARAHDIAVDSAEQPEALSVPYSRPKRAPRGAPKKPVPKATAEATPKPSPIPSLSPAPAPSSAPTSPPSSHDAETLAFDFGADVYGPSASPLAANRVAECPGLADEPHNDHRGAVAEPSTAGEAGIGRDADLRDAQAVAANAVDDFIGHEAPRP